MIDPANSRDVAALLPWPNPVANKYSRGRCILFAGGPRYGGAAVLAARAAQRMGAGYTQVFTAVGNEGLIRAAVPSVVASTWSATVLSHLIDATQERPLAYVVGPGLDADDMDTRQVTCSVLRAAAPVVADGGAIAILATRQARTIMENRRSAGCSTIITPHLGEAVRLYRGLGSAETPDQPADLARALAVELGVIACVKGPLTFISDGEATVCMSRGTAALAKAGTGDVLAGMTGALLAQGLAAADAAVLATTLHAMAGAIAAEAMTDIAVTPEDVIEALPRAIMALNSEGGIR